MISIRKIINLCPKMFQKERRLKISLPRSEACQLFICGHTRCFTEIGPGTFGESPFGRDAKICSLERRISAIRNGEIEWSISWKIG
jgi:hypothetical protein